MLTTLSISTQKEETTKSAVFSFSALFPDIHLLFFEREIHDGEIPSCNRLGDSWFFFLIFDFLDNVSYLI